MRRLRQAALAAIMLLALASLSAPAVSVVYHGNVKSGVFHRPGCRHYSCKNCIAVFPSREAAMEAGYRPCRVCNP